MRKRKIFAVIRIAIVLILFISSLIGIFKCDRDNIEKHLQECRTLCDPRKVIESFSRDKCFCLDEEEKNE